jgi:hypothetical protein
MARHKTRNSATHRRRAKALEHDEDESPKKRDRQRREAAAYLIGLLQNVRDALEEGVTWEQINHAVLSLKPERKR